MNGRGKQKRTNKIQRNKKIKNKMPKTTKNLKLFLKHHLFN